MSSSSDKMALRRKVSLKGMPDLKDVDEIIKNINRHLHYTIAKVCLFPLIKQQRSIETIYIIIILVSYLKMNFCYFLRNCRTEM
jgi:hypothetical protein